MTISSILLAASSATGGLSDPHFNKVVLLLHGDGVNGTQSIIDSSDKNTIVAAGNAQLSTALKKFGTASMQFDGNGDYFTSSSLANFDFGSLDFTVEAWVNISVSTNNTVVGVWDYGNSRRSWEIRIDSSNCLGIRYSANGSDNNSYYSSTALSTNTWHHIAYVRSGSNLVGYLDGVQVVSNILASPLFSNTVGQFRIGCSGDGSSIYPMNGRIDDLRITKGIARYTSNFTPPTQPFPNF